MVVFNITRFRHVPHISLRSAKNFDTKYEAAEYPPFAMGILLCYCTLMRGQALLMHFLLI